jgi:hypothetical protein
MVAAMGDMPLLDPLEFVERHGGLLKASADL